MAKASDPILVNELMRSAASGKASRRELVRKGAALGLGAGIMGTILQAHDVVAQGATPAAETKPAGWSIVVPEGLPNLDGVKLNIMLDSDGPFAPFSQACIDKFNDATGAQVTYLRGAESVTDRLTFMQQTMAAQAPDIDVAQIDVIWSGIFAPHAVDLMETYTNSGTASFQRIVDGCTIDGKMVALPWRTQAGLLYSRMDLLKKYGYDAPPTTWTELTEMATKVQEGEKATNSAFTGFTFQGAAYEGLTCNGLEWQYSNGGGPIIEDDGTVTVSNDKTKAMFEMAKGWVGTISPTAVTSYKEEDSFLVWLGGNAVFNRNWISNWYRANATYGEDFVVSQLPMGEGEGATHAAALGGANMFVSKYSQQQDAAKVLAAYMTSTELQKARAIEISNLPTQEVLYSDPDVLAANPFYPDLLDTFKSGSVPRPSTQSADLYGEVSLAYYSALNEILSGVASDVGGRVDELQSALEDIMSEL